MKKNSLSCAPKTAVAYARYSSAGQRDVSIEQQLNDIRAYAEREGYFIVHEYADRAKSGYKNVSARAEFQSMLAAAEKGGFDTVIAWKVDRFGRSRRDSSMYKGQLRDLGVRVVYAMEPIPAGAAGVLTEGMLESIAEWYSCNLSENVKRGMNDNAKKALYNGSPILGYKRGDDGHYTIDRETCGIVKRIFALYLSGYSLSSVAGQLNQMGFRTVRGKAFDACAVLRVIDNERYTGVYIWGEFRIPGGMPVLIDRKEWEDAQRMKAKTQRHCENTPVDFLLTGKLFCGLCGKQMVGDSGKSKTGKVHYYYSCAGHKVKGGKARSCEKKSVRKDDIEKAVIDSIYDNCLTGPAREKIADAIIAGQKDFQKDSPRDGIVKELKTVEKQLENINLAIANGIWSNSTGEMLKSLEEKEKQLNNTLAEIDFSGKQIVDRGRILFLLEKMAKNYDREDIERCKQLIHTFVNAVFVSDDELKICINAVEYAPVVSLSDVSNIAEGSDIVSNGLPKLIHPNSYVLMYRIPFPA